MLQPKKNINIFPNSVTAIVRYLLQIFTENANNDATAKARFTSEEARAVDRIQLDMYNEVRQAAEAHRQTRKHIQNWVKPGMKVADQ